MRKLEELRIKIKSLAFETAIIHKREQQLRRNALKLRDNRETLQAKYPELDVDAKIADLTTTERSLYEHRTSKNPEVSRLRNESRLSQIAYGYLRGRAYSDVETVGSYRTVDVEHLARIINRFKSSKEDPIFAHNVLNWMVIS
jgi:hypothetical protein